MSAMDCGVAKMPHNACFPARIQTHFKNQGSNSSLSHDVMPNSEPLPSPRRWSPTYQPRRRSRQFPTSLSFVPSTVITSPDGHDSTSSLPRRPADRAQVPISPFRSVRRMKEPFQLVLPSSPVSCDGGQVFPSTKPMRLSKPPGGHTLRTWRSDQNLKCGGLMPSPPISESRPASVGGSYFEHRNDLRKEKQAATLSPTKEHAEHVANVMIHYGGHCQTEWEHQSPKADFINMPEPHSNLFRHYEGKMPSSPHTTHARQPASMSSPVSASNTKPRLSANSPTIQRPRTATVSSEASWIPSNLAYCETWLQNVPYDPLDDKEQQPKEFTNRRKVQIVEQGPPMPVLSDLPTPKALEAPVRFAVASRPKLVNIAKQSSPNLPHPVPPRLQPSLPMTPAQRQEEVSAFSPDTPMEIPNNDYEPLQSAFSFSSYEDSKDDDTYTDPGSLTSDSVTSTVVYERPESAQGKRATSPQPEIRSGSVSPKASSPKTLSSGHRSNSPQKHEEDKQRTWDREWTLDELAHSVNDFPRHMLRLTSPVIVFIRGSDEQVLLRHFRTIFPEVADNLLDCLCAALVARNYLISLSNLHRHKPSLPPRSDIYAVDSVPTKAYSTLGIQLPTGAPGRIKDRLFTSRSTDLRRDIERIVDNLMFAICGRSDDTIKAAVEVLVQVLETNAVKS
ncbi:hypothetical protein N7495_009349 [Penicillium taxi]|uniref:uncharacterized protein n=1 Tax=Penicillium taxi TaxID=168475 RepID=UPI002544E1AA|nr:uncharacterized protein N7495_009349 [Penicillium taxi]KAJ5884839.1 hypothetical protein N7495_009349 [Penicillium taxi]